MRQKLLRKYFIIPNFFRKVEKKIQLKKLVSNGWTDINADDIENVPS